MVEERLTIEYSYRIDEHGEIKERITERMITNGVEHETSHDAPVAPFMQAWVDAAVKILKVPKETALGLYVNNLRRDIEEYFKEKKYEIYSDIRPSRRL